MCRLFTSLLDTDISYLPVVYIVIKMQTFYNMPVVYIVVKIQTFYNVRVAYIFVEKQTLFYAVTYIVFKIHTFYKMPFSYIVVKMQTFYNVPVVYIIVKIQTFLICLLFTSLLRYRHFIMCRRNIFSQILTLLLNVRFFYSIGVCWQVLFKLNRKI